MSKAEIAGGEPSTEGRIDMISRIRDWHQTLSWKLGYGRGKEGRAYTCPWWVDKTVYALAYMQGKSVTTKEAAN